MTGKICRYCKLPVDESEYVPTFSYWGAVEFASHKACLKAGVALEAFECQVIDADCNDCKHFQRGKPNLFHSDKIDPRTGKPHVINLQSWSGTCRKFDKPTTAFPNFCTGHACFEHRRAS